MTSTVYVTRAERLAAQALVERAARFGRPIDRATVLIANAKPAGAGKTEHEVAEPAR